MAKHVSVVFAAGRRQRLWTLELPDEATVRQALAAAEALAGPAGDGIDWQSAPVGIFGEPCGRGAVPRDGDRIELYRPLLDDPKDRRRQRAGR